jgi:hypothetical protein
VVTSTASERKWLSKHRKAALTLAVTFTPSHGRALRAAIDLSL